MSLPGVSVTVATTPPARTVATNTGKAFIVGLFQKGKDGVPITAADGLTSLNQFIAALGGRQSYSVAYDWADAFFREGGAVIYPARVVGPGAAAAYSDLAGTSGTTLRVTAKYKGDYANTTIQRQVTNGTDSTTRIIKILDGAGNLLEQTPQFSNELDAVAWSAGSQYVTITKQGGTGLPTVVSAALLSGGTDDRANVTNTQILVALGQFGVDLGPGQVAAPGWTSSAIHQGLAAHAATFNRFAVCDAPDTGVKSTLTALAAASQGGTNASYMGLFAPWVTIPGTAGSSSGRTVPPSALVCARAAVTDATDSANQAPAGRWGQARYATGVTQTFSRVPVAGVIDAEDLNNAGVNLVIVKSGAVRVYGNRTLVDPAGNEANWIQLSNARYRMSIKARGQELGEPYVFGRITPAEIAEFRKDLIGMLLRDYRDGDLYGDPGDDRPETAFNVVTDDPVNTPVTAQAGQLNAAINVRPTRGGEMVSISITATALTEPVA